MEMAGFEVPLHHRRAGRAKERWEKLALGEATKKKARSVEPCTTRCSQIAIRPGIDESSNVRGILASTQEVVGIIEGDEALGVAGCFEYLKGR